MRVFPTLVYQCPGMFARPGGTYRFKPIADQAQMTAALGDGWFETLPQAIEGKSPAKAVEAVEPAVNAPVTRDELEQKAAELGVKVDGRWSDTRLRDEITKRLK